MTLTKCYILLYVFRQTGLSKQFRPRWDAAIIDQLIDYPINRTSLSIFTVFSFSKIKLAFDLQEK